MKTTSRVDQHPLAEHHGRRERPPTRPSARQLRAHDAPAGRAEARGDEGDPYVRPYYRLRAAPGFSSVRLQEMRYFGGTVGGAPRGVPRFEHAAHGCGPLCKHKHAAGRYRAGAVTSGTGMSAAPYFPDGWCADRLWSASGPLRIAIHRRCATMGRSSDLNCTRGVRSLCIVQRFSVSLLRLTSRPHGQASVVAYGHCASIISLTAY